MTTAMRNVWVLPLLVVSLGGVGCLDLLGFKDPVLDECAPAGCTGGGGSGGGAGGGGNTTTGGGGSGGTVTTTGSAGGGGAGTFECFPVGTEFEVLGEGDIPGAEETSTFFIVPEASSASASAHLVTKLDLATGSLVARTVAGFDDVGGVLTWTPPTGGAYLDGYATPEKVVLLGSMIGDAGAAAAEFRLSKGADGDIESGIPAEVVELERPSGCAAPEASIDSLFFSRTGGQTWYASTWDDCDPDTRRLYWWSGDGEPQEVRAGEKADPSLALAGYAHVGNSELMVFFDGKSSGYSSGASVGALEAFKPVSLGSAGTTTTAPAAVLSVAPNAAGVFWSVFTTGTIVPVEIHGQIAVPDKLGALEDPTGYSKVVSYGALPDVTVWARPTVGQGKLVVGGRDLDGSAARFSILSTAGKPLQLDRVAATGTSGSIGSVAAAPLGETGVLVAWQRLDGSALTVRGRVFDCQ